MKKNKKDVLKSEHKMKPPSRFWLLIQPLAILELIIYFLILPYLLLRSPKGKGLVLILPGLLIGDWYMWPMKITLKLKGYKVYGWGNGTNIGYNDRVNKEISSKIQKISKNNDGEKITLIGFSLGGIYARNIAQLNPNLINKVFTISTPFMSVDNSINIQNIYRFISGKKIEDDVDPKTAERIKARLSFPSISIYSFFDGIVSLESCVEKEDDDTFDHEVIGTHCGLPHNYSVMKIILNKLADE
jgi:pimeloyl-ACP methyl ester carboxylesterase